MGNGFAKSIVIENNCIQQWTTLLMLRIQWLFNLPFLNKNTRNNLHFFASALYTFLQTSNKVVCKNKLPLIPTKQFLNAFFYILFSCTRDMNVSRLFHRTFNKLGFLCAWERINSKIVHLRMVSFSPHHLTFVLINLTSNLKSFPPTILDSRIFRSSKLFLGEYLHSTLHSDFLSSRSTTGAFARRFWGENKTHLWFLWKGL